METTAPDFFGIPRKAFFFSLSLHAGLAFTLLLFSSAPGASLLSFLFGKKPDSLSAQEFVQVDVVGLPDDLAFQKINPLLPEVSEPTTTKEKTSPKPIENKEVMEEPQSKKEKQTKEKEQRNAEEKALKLAQEEAKREQALRALKNKAGGKGRGKIKGNILSEGTSSSGTVGTAKDKYIGILTESIKQQFNVFSWQQKKELMAEVKLVLLPNGRVKWRKIIRPSKDVMYDSAVLQAIDDAQPFPVPADKSLIQDEITINFKP